jgi:hypothetical protein
MLPYTRFCNCLLITITFYTLLTSLFCILLFITRGRTTRRSHGIFYKSLDYWKQYPQVFFVMNICNMYRVSKLKSVIFHFQKNMHVSYASVQMLRYVFLYLLFYHIGIIDHITSASPHGIIRDVDICYTCLWNYEIR